MTFNRGLDC